MFDLAHRASCFFFCHLRPFEPPSGPRKQFVILYFAKYRFGGFDCQCAKFADFAQRLTLVYVHILWSLFDIDLVNLGKLHRLQGCYFLCADNMLGHSINQIVAKNLDKKNFHVWKFRMTNFLMGKGYWEYIDGDQEKAPELPEETPTTAQVKAYKD